MNITALNFPESNPKQNIEDIKILTSSLENGVMVFISNFLVYWWVHLIIIRVISKNSVEYSKLNN